MESITPSPATPPSAPASVPPASSLKPSGPNSALLITVAAIALIIFLAIVSYFLYSPRIPPGAEGPAPTPVTSGTPTPADAEAAALLQQSPSDDIADIERDLNATDLSNLDRELGDIDAALTP